MEQGLTKPRAKRRSKFDDFMRRFVFILVAAFLVVYLIAIFVTEQPVIALAAAAVIVVVPIAHLVRK